MSAREFRERYSRLASLAGPTPTRPVSLTSTELPAGATTASTPEGEIVTFKQTFDGPEAQEARMLLDALPDVRAEEMIFLDTETTGLAGGTGTYAFLVGLGRFANRGFVVDQYFMRNPADEHPMLTALSGEFSSIQRLVTYNGRSFDVPLLESRFRLAHRSMPLDFDHLDVLHISRAIWKHRLASCSLSNIESTILGVERELDAPGWLIPSIYFDYLRSRRPDQLIPVIEHNRIDIYSLARLTALVLSYELGILEPVNTIDRTSVALHRIKRFGVDLSEDSSSQHWTDRRAPADLRRQLLAEVSRQHKRHNRHQTMERGWQIGMTDPSRAIRDYCAVELAKYYEHQVRDFETALKISQIALDSARLVRDDASIQEHLHRVGRLQRKLGQTSRVYS